MSSPEEEHTDYMLAKAVAYQQEFYELLPNWTDYKRDNIKHLKQNIGYAIFGPPLSKQHSTSNDIVKYEVDNTTNNKEINDLICYGSDAQCKINLIAEKICKYGCRPGEDFIRCGIIYVLLINNNSSAGNNKKKNTEHIALPVFKIFKYNDNKNVSKQESRNSDYVIWYIDINARIYQSWDNFLKTNNLPECIMVYPKDGYYQPNPAFKIAPNHSFVWVITQDSYACCKRAKIYSKINTAVNAIGTGATVGLGIATFFTPVAPVVTTASLVTAGASGIWTIGTCSADLYDKSVHKESINPLNKKSALSSWLGIAGCTVGLAVSGGSVVLRRVAMSGRTVGTAAKTAYNTALIGSISLNLIGVGYQGVNVYTKYQETGTIDMQDVLYFGTHLLFFMNSIVDIKFAKGIIEMTQGKILREYEANLRDDNLLRHYNNTKNTIAGTTVDKIEQNAAIIRHINKFNTSNISELQPINNSLRSSNNMLMVQQYKLKLNGITLLDPILFIADFVKSYFPQAVINTSEESSNSASTYQKHQLEKILEKLLGDFYTSRECPSDVQFYGIPDFKIIIDEMKRVKQSEDILPFIFNIALILVKESNRYIYLIEGCRFVWDYIKKSMFDAGLEISSKSCINNCDTFTRHIKAILGALFFAMDSLVNRFLNAFHQYIQIIKINPCVKNNLMEGNSKI